MSASTLTRPPRRLRTARVVIVDDHELARAGLRGMLSSARSLLIVGEASTGRAAIRKCDELRPDLVLMDVRMPDMDGLVATEMIKRAHPEIAVVMMTSYDNEDYILEAIRAGAAGYLLKDTSRAELVATIESVLAGENLLSQRVSERLPGRITRDGPATTHFMDPGLTPRERDVLRLLVRGYTNRRIGEELGIGAGTVKTHVERLIAKLGVSDRTQAAVRAVELRLHDGGR